MNEENPKIWAIWYIDRGDWYYEIHGSSRTLAVLIFNDEVMANRYKTWLDSQYCRTEEVISPFIVCPINIIKDT